MLLSVALLPGTSSTVDRQVCVVVDVLRASSTIVTMFDRGCRRIVVAAGVDAARARLRPGGLLCGEQGGLPPEGFHHGNSPVELAALDLTGREAVFCTTNGTVALGAVASAPAVLVGALLNARAVAAAALNLARAGGHGITIVCAGRGGGTRFAIDDAFCAGAILTHLRYLLGSAKVQFELDDGAHAAHRLVAAGAAGNLAARALATFRLSDSGRHLARLGLEADVRYCAQVDLSQTVPRLSTPAGEPALTAWREEEGLGGPSGGRCGRRPGPCPGG